MKTPSNITQVLAVTATVLILSTMVTTVADASKVGTRSRLNHAKELLGGTYKRSVVRHSEKAKDMAEFIESMTRKFLPKTYEKRTVGVASAIIHEAEKYGLDPVFLMAVVQNESSFNPEMRGSFGEIGLMQVKPSTAQWICDLYKIKYKGDKSLLDPVSNIRIGAAFMHKLRDQFDSHSRLYISAYNIGAKKVRVMVSEDRIPKEYVQAVMKRYVALYSAFGKGVAPESRAQVAWAKLKDVTRTIASQDIVKVVN